jgi:alkyl sulfatase BDS1-like metallo-beta-lactamase superfamily hydrolase
MQAMTVEMVFDLLGACLDGPLADGTSLALGWSFSDAGEQWTLRVEHGALNCWPVLDDDVDATVTLTRQTLIDVLVDGSPIPAAVEDGTVAIEGDAGALDRLLALLDGPNRRFTIIEP